MYDKFTFILLCVIEALIIVYLWHRLQLNVKLFMKASELTKRFGNSKSLSAFFSAKDDAVYIYDQEDRRNVPHEDKSYLPFETYVVASGKGKKTKTIAEEILQRMPYENLKIDHITDLSEHDAMEKFAKELEDE